MPKVLYTTAKGLHQKAGSYCELPVKKQVIALTNAATTARSLAIGESGSLITLDPSTATATTITITLPTASTSVAGVYYDFCWLADAGHASADTIITTGANGTDIFGYMVRGGANSTVLDFDGVSKITNDASVGTDCNGARLTLLCDGTHWHLSGYSKVVVGTADFVESATA
jgi:hypothetical protein